MTSPAEVRKPVQDIYRDSSYITNIYSYSTKIHLPSVGSGRTLRETVLESSPVLALLNESFVSSWSLVKELESMQVKIPLPSSLFFVYLKVECHVRLRLIHSPAFSRPICRQCIQGFFSLTNRLTSRTMH